MQARVLILSPDVIGERMAGSGIRYWEVAHALAQDMSVTLAMPVGSTPEPTSTVHSTTYRFEDQDQVRNLIDEHDTVLVAGHAVSRLPILQQVDQPIAVDLYIPSILENLEIHSARQLEERSAIHSGDLSALVQALQIGDFFVCASEKQRDLWLGALLATNRVNPETYTQDVALRKLIDVVPFGLPAELPVHTSPVLKGVNPKIATSDKVILWGGGIWDWLDPLTLIDAVARLVAGGAPVKLFFMGTRHPNPDVPEMKAVARARHRSRELELWGTHVFFHDWVAYSERQNFLLEADVGASLHLDHIETRFSYRTRVLDYIWAGLPMVLTEGDALSDFVAQSQLGIIVSPQDVDSLAKALATILSKPDPRSAYRQQFMAVQPLMTWERAVEPLRQFVRDPWKAPDRLHRTSRTLQRDPGRLIPVAPPPSTPPWQLPVKAWRTIQRGGISQLMVEVRSYLRWLRERNAS